MECLSLLLSFRDTRRFTVVVVKGSLIAAVAGLGNNLVILIFSFSGSTIFQIWCLWCIED